MKFISYKHNSEPKFGIIDNNLITDLTGKISGADTLKDLIFKNGISEAKTYASTNPGNLNEDDIEFDTTSIRSSYSTNTTSDSSCSSVGNIRSHGHHHHGINLEPNGNRILIQQHGYHNKDNQKDKRNQRYSNKNYSQVKKNSSSSINSCVSTINASHRVILSLSSDDSHISSNNTPNITDKPQGSHIDKKTSSVKTNLSQFYQCKAKDQNNLTLSNLNSSSDTLLDLLENDGSKKI